jgi:hypothetical protein
MFATAGLTTTAMVRRIRVIECSNGDDDIDEDKQTALHVVGLLVAQERAHNEHSEDQGNGIEHFELHVHGDVEAPTDNDNKRRVEECGLDRGTEDVSKSQVHLAIPCLIDGKEVFWLVLVTVPCTWHSRLTSSLLYDGNKDKTHEGVADVTLLHHVGNLDDQEHGDHGNAG